MKILDRMSDWARRKLGREPVLFEDEAAKADPVGALDAVIEELERTRADALKVLARAKPRDREKLEAALATLESRIQDARARRIDLAARLAAKQKLERLASEASVLTEEARSLSDDERNGERGARIRARVEAIRREVASLQK
jgi:hypothetical protein